MRKLLLALIILTAPAHAEGPTEAEKIWQLGSDYEHGENGKPYNCAMAMKLYAKAGDLGMPEAAHSLGCIYRDGCPGVMKPDDKMAFKLYLYAAKQGVALSQNNVGVYLWKGYPEQNLAKAYAWIKLAEQNGDELATENLSKFAGTLTEADKKAGLAHIEEIKKLLLAPGDDPKKAQDLAY